MMSGGAVNIAATMAVLGLPAWRFLRTRDREEKLLLLAVAERAVRVHDAMQRNLAAHIVNAYSKARR
jgi:hypothetical protein